MLLPTLLVAGCADRQDTSGQGSGPQRSPTTHTSSEPAPSIEFTAGGFRYAFAATNAEFSPTGDPANTTVPLPPGETYLVVSGELTNLQDDRPAPLDILADIGVSVPLTALAAVITETVGTGNRCENLHFPIGAGPARSLPGGQCLLTLSVSERQINGTIGPSESTQATYVCRLPDKLPRDQFRLVGFKRGDRYSVTSSHPLPWR